MKEAYSLITIELTSDEQISLMGLLVASTNSLIASDPNNWLPDLERIEEKIGDAQEASSGISVSPIIMDYRYS